MTAANYPNSNIEDTLVYAINEGNDLGYADEASYDNNHLIIKGISYTKDQVRIDKTIRFEGMSNPADNMIYFRLSTTDGSKGYFVSAYGPRANIKAMRFFQDTKKKNTYSNI